MTVDLNVVLPLASSLLSFIFFIFLIDQWRERRRSYQLIWAVGMLWYALSAGTEFIGGAYGWSGPLYRTWYLIGAVWVAGWLGLGRWVHVAGGVVGVGTLVSGLMVLTATLAPPGWIVNPDTHIPTGELFPGYLRLLTPFFNITGAFALTLGALYSTYVFMPKRRMLRYSLDRQQPRSRLVGNLLVAPVAIVVNFLASIPVAVAALVRGRLNSRVPATILIALGGLIPAITSGANRFGATSGFFVGELLGVAFLFTGFLVSIEVFREIRIPFTHVVIARRAEA